MIVDFTPRKRYRVLREIGAGAQGRVYEAYDEERDVRVAIKRLRDRGYLEVFKREFRAAQGFRHPNVVALGELVVEEDECFFTMELVEGRDFVEHVRGARRSEGLADGATFDEAKLRGALAQLADGLNALHAAGRVHRDIKPSNVLVTAEGRVKILDFGLLTRAGREPGSLVGTPYYLAPEQAAGALVGPEADWYAVGGMLYVVLTGRLPFRGTTGEVLEAKQRRTPLPPRSWVDGIPDDLNNLCMHLLRRDPRERARIGEVPRESKRTVPFVGRSGELALLAAALEDVEADQKPIAVMIEGESGVGKSCLLRAFKQRLPREAIVFSGRGYERETIPFRALDGVIHALARHSAYGPRAALWKLVDRGPVVIVVDDLRWSDRDTIAYLGDMLRPPDGPPVLLVAAVQGQLGGSLSIEVRRVKLEPLPRAHARELAYQLISGEDRARRAEEIAGAAKGHPLFIEELARRGDAPSLGHALAARFGALEEGARLVLELVALAGVPVFVETLEQAAKVPSFDAALERLRAEGLVRAPGTGRTDLVECYHDRVREAAALGLTPGARRDRHARLARAIEESSEFDPEALAMHLSASGDLERAATHAELAGDQAAAAAAFDRAACLYRVAVESGRASVRVKLGDALASAGKARDAAAVYEDAMVSADADLRLELERRAAEQLLRCGRIRRATERFAAVLDALGMRFARTPLGALVALVFYRLWIRLRGLSFRPNDVPHPVEATRVDVCGSIAFGLWLVDPVRGAHFQARYLLLALKLGERTRVARALALEAAYRAAFRGQHAGIPALAARVADESGDALVRAQVVGISGIAAYLRGRFREASALCDRAEVMLRDGGVDAGYELATVRLFAIASLAYAGELAELKSRARVAIVDAESRGNLFAAAALRAGHANLLFLAEDDPRGARRQLDDAVTHRTGGAEHFLALRSHALIDLYTGDPGAARRRLDEGWRAASRTMLARVPTVRAELLTLRATAALASGVSAERDIERLAREKVAWAPAMAALLGAGELALRGDPDAVTEARRAIAALEEAECHLHAAAARRRLGETVGGDEGVRLVEEADSWLRDRGIAVPARFAATLVCSFEPRDVPVEEAEAPIGSPAKPR